MSDTRHLTFRIRPSDLHQIDQLAAKHHMSRSQYVITVATGQMPAQHSEALERIELLEQRLDRVDEALFQTTATNW